MIQIRRGKTFNWRKTSTRLAEGQPGYDKDKHKLKVGDGKTGWYDLPYATGLFAEEILNSEVNAKARFKADSEDITIISHGTEYPDKETTVGQLYLQYYASEPETDYIVEYGTSGIWTYQKWYSGIAKCWGTYEFKTSISRGIENNTGTNALYNSNEVMDALIYPFTFVSRPSESATLQSPGGLVWLAGSSKNTNKHSAKYRLVSTDEQINTAEYSITLSVEGYWREKK